MKNPPGSSPEVQDLLRGVLRLDAKVLALTLGLLGALAIFAATNWLVLKGGPPVGPHLSLLSQYFIGYRVTFAGSFVGAAWGFAAGAAAGVVIAWVYNRVAAWRQ
ncbi:MAG: hypothetical protein AB1578_20015 [Thermodesulfobacteriota bacterium]